jgi:ribonuclease P protein component
LSDSPPSATWRRLKRRSDFLRAAAGKRFHSKAFTLQAAPGAGPDVLGNQGEAGGASRPPRFGFTVTKKIGKAVVRNRIRRRLKEAVRTLDPLPARPGHDYVMTARAEASSLPFTALQAELVRALEKVAAGKARVDSSFRRSQRHRASEKPPTKGSPEVTAPAV